MGAPPAGALLERFRAAIARRFSSTLTGISSREWWRLLRENRFAVSPVGLPRAAILAAASVGNSLGRWLEERRFGPRLVGVEVEPPLFVLGHWRSGTTHLHNLLAVDDRFGYPNLYQTVYPHHFLVSEKTLAPLWTWFLPRTRLIDNMANDFKVPFEDEFAHSITTLKSPYLGWVFPRREEHYDRYLTFRGVAEEEVDEWRRGLLHFLRKLTWKTGATLVLKSPPHTCRVRLLLSLFPRARFIHIRRHPFEVFLSTCHMVRIASATSNLQRLDFSRLEERVIRIYQVMHQAYFEERGLIPEGQFHELAYEDLERDPLEQLEVLYERLHLPPFAAARPAVERYLEGIRGYRKNRHPELPAALRRRLASAWRRNLEEWGYSAA